MHTHERRSSTRFPFDLTGYAIINGNNARLNTRDISLGGALVEFIYLLNFLKVGTKMQVRLNIGVTGRAIVCRVNIRDNCTLYSLKYDRFDSYSDLILSAYFVKYEPLHSGTVSLTD